MRQGQHKNRSRGRNQRRPGGNSTNRVFESNGPDVKVRGTAQTVADKYLQLARDAVSAGDIVMSESYFQHAEHYNRIIAANQSQQQQQQQRSQEAAAGDSGQQRDTAPGTGPQPVEVRTDESASDQTDEAEAKANGVTEAAASKEEVASFDGELPQFMQEPVEDAEVAEKPKRGRRTSSQSKTAKSDKGNKADSSAEKTSSDSKDESASDAEAAVG